jgi:hypothetical protein
MLHIVGHPEGGYVFLCFAQHNANGKTLLVYQDLTDDSFRAMPFEERDIFDASTLPRNRRFEFHGIADPAAPSEPPGLKATSLSTQLQQIESLAAADYGKYHEQKNALLQIRGIVRSVLKSDNKKGDHIDDTAYL